MRNWVLPAAGIVLIAAGGAIAVGALLLLFGRRS